MSADPKPAATSSTATATSPFPKVDTAIKFPETEAEILALWKRERVFERSLEKPAPAGSFVFYEGPPTANGTPHNGHVLTRVMKDLFPRYKTMRGHRVDRKAGWDTHGLPVEVEVEKELRIHGKAAIEDFGVEPFVRKCIDSVFRYTEDWEKLTESLGFWVDLPNAYVTYHRSFVESVWWALAKLFDQGLLYQAHKVVWWWAQGGTALSSGEVGQGYKTVDDPSAFVRFPLRELPPGAPVGLALAAWTTTPWTLPSNMYAAVKKDAVYVDVHVEGGPVLIAEPLAKAFAEKTKGTVGGYRIEGDKLVGLRYQPPFSQYFERAGELRAANGEALYWRVIGEDFVTLDSGTGIVHIAPAFGEDDYKAFRALAVRLDVALDLFCCVASDGTFTSEAPEKYRGRWVKSVDHEILADLKHSGVLLHKEIYKHDYPFCWRADDDPLIQYARPAWFIKTTSKKDEAIANNRAVSWLPPHIKEGRFGDFLANNVDWALSRERFWGTPLPIWICSDCGHQKAFSSVAEIEKVNPKAFDHFHAAKAKDPSLNDHLIVHKPWIDQVTVPCEKCGKEARRVTEVIDCWFDSGCMPFAQWGFPHAPGSVDKLRQAWPADFISEAIDQTRGWFYSLLMISTLVFDEAERKKWGLEQASAAHPYKTCIVLGHVGDREGKKESKSKGNYTPPEVILSRVRMEFAVVDEAAAKHAAKPGEVLIAREDLDGLDLQDGASVVVYRGDLPDAHIKRLVVRAQKGLPRRVVVMNAADREAIGARLYPKGLDVKPVEVPRLPAGERVYLEDPTAPAPGADAFRWFFYASSPPWTNTRHSLSNVRALQKDFAIKLRNVYGFFSIYAGIDGFDPKKHQRRACASLENALDRWILGELASAHAAITAHMDRYESYEATGVLVALVESLSNWYVRRCRDRFWASGTAADSQDKRDAYGTLHEVLVGVAELAAPFVPFLAEEMYQGLMVAPFGREVPVSVHLRDWPRVDASAIDTALARQMADARSVVSLGLQVRTASKAKVRQPLASATIVATPDRAEGLQKHAAVIAEELNVKQLLFVTPDRAGEYVSFALKPNFRALGPKIGKQVQAVKAALEKADAGSLRAQLVSEGRAEVPGVTIDGAPLFVTPEEIEVTVFAKEGFAAAGERVGVVVLDTRVTPELRAEGLARELQNRLQNLRKELGLAYEERVDFAVHAPTDLFTALAPHRERVGAEVLARTLILGDAAARDDAKHAHFASPERREVEVDGEVLDVVVGRVR
jgi:isoleucyl-tRNA synthetase